MNSESPVIFATVLSHAAIERFWKKVDKSPGHGPKGDCWVWIGYLDRHGYGGITIRAVPQLRLAHRVAWLLSAGSLRLDGEVMHTCDFPPCVRHLQEGTHQENLKDCWDKGRGKHSGVFGERVGNHKLTAEQVREIRNTFGHVRRGYDAIGQSYGVTGALIGMILRQEIWRKEDWDER